MDGMIEKLELLEKFLKNGMNISQFHFQSNLDKENLFEMYKEYLIGLNNNERDIETLYDREKNLVVMIDGMEHCTFEVTPDYDTLLCHTIHDTENVDLVFVLTAFFLTLKELSSMIQKLSEVFSSLSPQSKKSTVTKSSNRKYKALPPDVINSMNKIRKLQKSILSENKKYDLKPIGDKDD